MLKIIITTFGEMNNKAIDNMLSGTMNISILEIYNLIYGLDANNLLIERKNKKILFLIFSWYWYYIDLLWLLIIYFNPTKINRTKYFTRNTLIIYVK